MAYIIFLVAFLIRLIYILQLKSTIFYNNFLLDEAFYSNWAKAICSGDWIGQGIFDGLPLYPYILGVIYKIFNSNPFAPRLIAITISSFSCVMIYLLGKRLFSRRAGQIAAFIACVYGPFIFYSGALVPTSYVIFFYLLSSQCFLRIRKHPSAGRFLIFGLVVGLATLVRAGILLFVLPVLGWFIFTFEDKKKALIGALLSIVAILAVVLPVTLRNYLVSGEKVFLTSHAGINFYIGNNKDADGTFNPPEWARSNIEGLKSDVKTIAEEETGKTLTDPEVSSYYAKKALKFIRYNPGRSIKLFGKKLLLYLNKQEIYDVAHYDVRQKFIPILKLPFIPFLIVGVLGLPGFFLAFSKWRHIAPIYLFTIFYAISILLYFVNSRYRIPFATAMILFSGFFIDWVINTWFERKRKARWILASSLLAVSFLVVNLPTGIERSASGYTNLGNLYVKTKQWDKAMYAFKEASLIDYDNPKPYNDMAYAYIQQNRYDDAEKFLREALQRDINYPYAHLNLGLLFEMTKNYSFAESEYKRSIELNPNIAQAHNNLANVYEATGRRYMAIKEYKLAIGLDPYNVKTHHNLGIIYGRAGRLKESRREFEKALELDPTFKPAKIALEVFKSIE